MIFIESIIRKFLGKRKSTSEETHDHMMRMYNKLEKYSLRDAKLYGYLQPFENNLKVLKERYYRVNMYEHLLSEYKKNRRYK